MSPVEQSGDVVLEMEEVPTIPQPKKAGCWGRAFQDWSQYVIAPTAIAGGAVAIYEYTVRDYVIAGVTTAITVALVVSFVRISTLKPRKELEDQINFFKNQVIALTKENKKLDHSIYELKMTEIAIRDHIKNAKKAVSSLGEMLEGENKDFEELANRMEMSVETTKKMMEAYHGINNTLQGLGNEINRFNALRKQFAQAVKEFSGEVNELDRNESDLSEEVDEFGENVDEIKENQENLKKEFVKFEEFGKEVQADIGDLKSNVDKLEEMLPGIGDAPVKLNEEFRKINYSIKELVALVDEGEKSLADKVVIESSKEK